MSTDTLLPGNRATVVRAISRTTQHLEDASRGVFVRESDRRDIFGRAYVNAERARLRQLKKVLSIMQAEQLG